MFCDQCGAENSETAKFCRKCGADLTGEVATQVAVRAPNEAATQAEDTVFSIGPTLLFVKAGYALAAVVAVVFVGLLTAFSPVSTWIAVLFGLLLFAAPAFFHVRQKLITYTLTRSKLEIDEGLIARRTRSVPLARIQDVTVSASVIQRLLGLGDLMIDNASEDGGKLVLANINAPRTRADELMRQMREIEK
jgi:uncharacterized membrane protein YdbT with pleckstrin-like domain